MVSRLEAAPWTALVECVPNFSEGTRLEVMDAIQAAAGSVRGAWVLDHDDTARFARELLAQGEPKTAAEDVDVVLRWFGAQRPPARLICLPDEPQAAADAIEDAASGLLLLAGEARPAGLEDPLDALVDP